MLPNALRICCTIAVMASGPVFALDLIPKLFEREVINAVVWELNEQYMRLVPQDAKDTGPNQHPVTIDKTQLKLALSGLELWIEGGVFRDEQSAPVFNRSQIDKLSRYLPQALAKAKPSEDVTFNVRGYADVLLDLAKEKEWTAGRAFYVNDQLHIIIGDYRRRLDKSKKQVEGSFGITDDYRGVHFKVGSRRDKGPMPGKIVTTGGVIIHNTGNQLRSDWIELDLAGAAIAYQQAQMPEAVRRQEKRAEEAAAQLTMERREMREEMARLRKQLQDLQQAGNAKSIEERLTTLEDLRNRGLIDNDEFLRRREEILQDI
ncbi:MAG: SHOCT domain-containing protein [Pseudomonadota bacterium]